MPYEPRKDDARKEPSTPVRPPSERSKERDRAQAGREHGDLETDKPEPGRHPGLDGDVVGR